MRKRSISASLHRLIYCSRLAEGVPGTNGQEAIDAILAISRERNTADGLTGALLFTGQAFAHVLEGAREAVDRTFDRIFADRRHADVTVLSFIPTERRCFADWPLAYADRSPAGTDRVLGTLLADAANGRPRLTTGNDILRLLEGILRHERSLGG